MAIGRVGRPAMVYTREQAEERGRFLTPSRRWRLVLALAVLVAQRRDYGALAGLAGYGRE